MSRTKRRMSAFLPPTPCTPELRQAVQKFAEDHGRSIADIQRDALSLFLLRDDTDSVNSVIEGVKVQEELQTS